MRTILALFGLVNIPLGIALVSSFGISWYDNNAFPSDLLLRLFGGLFLTTSGSLLIAAAFKGNLSINDNALVKSSLKIQRSVYALLLMQFAILVFQIVVLLCYDGYIEQYMSTISKEGNITVEKCYLATAYMPIFSQFVFIPLIWFKVFKAAKNTWRGACISLFSIWLASFSWVASFMGFGFTMGTFD